MDGATNLADGGRDLEDLLTRLEEAESTIRAIRSGDVDALVIAGPSGERVFTLKSADQSYRTLVETMNEGAATLAPGGTISYCNQRFSELLGIPQERVMGSDLVRFFSNDRHADIDDLLRHGLVGPWHCETELRASNGGRVPVLLSASPATIDDTTSICLVATDLTAQKRNEEIVASEKLARSILDQAVEAIVVCDKEGIIIRANPVARKLLRSVTSGALFECAAPLILDSGEPFSIDAVLAGKQVAALEARLTAGQEEVIVLISAGPLTNADGEVTGAVIALTDITERKLHEETLRQQAEALARSNADLERFAFAASHDLQEPLRMITTYTQLLIRQQQQAGHTDKDSELFAGFIAAGAERMRTLIRDLLTYSRATHEPSADFHHIDMNAVLRIAAANLEHSIKECAAVITSDALPPAYGDGTQLAQVLQNLISNAIKYCERKPPRIHIGAVEAEHENTYSVRDNGVGIAPQYMQQVFGLFKRLHGKEVPGNGIGLAVAKRIVELHGGRIWVESDPGNGSTFYFTIPRENGGS
jgi:PAS domain S-box-containing protein